MLVFTIRLYTFRIVASMSMYIRDQNECDLFEIKKKEEGKKVERIILLCQKRERER